MNHTLLSKNNKQSSIFKILDEITSYLENIKFQLKKIGFDENKLELAMEVHHRVPTYLYYMDTL